MEPVPLNPDSDAVALDRAVFEFPGVPLYVFGGERIGVGREGPDLRLDSDAAATSKRISTHHFDIWREGSGFAIADVGSTNGTIVDGSALVAREAHTLAANARILVAGVLELKTRTLQPPASRPPAGVDATAPALFIEHPDFMVALVPGRFALRAIVQNSTPDAELYFADGGLWLRGLSDLPSQCRAVADGVETPWRATVRRYE